MSFNPIHNMYYLYCALYTVIWYQLLWISNLFSLLVNFILFFGGGDLVYHHALGPLIIYMYACIYQVNTYGFHTSKVSKNYLTFQSIFDFEHN